MADLRNIQLDLSRFRTRVWLGRAMVVSLFLVLLSRLIFLQIVRHEDLLEQAENNRTSVVPTVPNRGLILDRNGVVLATNYSAYTLEITPAKVPDLEKLIDDLSHLIPIGPKDKKHFRKLMEESKGFESLPIRTRLTDIEVAQFTAQQFRFPAVEVKARLYRNYPYGELASHVIGYIGRINTTEKAKLEESEEESNYRGTEYIGKLGIEQAYEKRLHGITGVEELETSAGGQAVRRLKSSPATPGDTITLAIDIKLQHLVETMFGDRRGALVALDPNTGEVLALVSKPTFDPNLFVEGIDVDNWRALNESINKPLLNRAIRGTYPPGSTYKPFMAMAALQTGVRSATAIINDPGYWMFGDHKFRSHGDGGLGSVDMYRSIVASSNVYYYSLANDLGVEAMHDFMKPLGFGQITGIDLQGEVRGVLPNHAWKKATYKNPELQKWHPGDTISLGIGQGYNNFTMLQLAQATSIVANGGFRHQPRLMVATHDALTRKTERLPPPPAENLGFKPENVEVVKRAMVGVTRDGTSARAFAGAGYLSGGKTGTAQAVSIGQKEKYDAGKLEEAKRDHALYMAYAPADNPQIAVAVVVENAGFGGEHAAPIARRVFDYWVKGLYPNADDMAAVQKGQAASPRGAPIKAVDVKLVPTSLASALADMPSVLPIAAASATASAAAPAATGKASAPGIGGVASAASTAYPLPSTAAPLTAAQALLQQYYVPRRKVTAATPLTPMAAAMLQKAQTQQP
jgi:penicillin-binding protein 2